MNYKLLITLLGSFFLTTACSSDEPSEIAEPTAAAEDQAASGKSMTDIAAEHITDEYIREVMIEISSDEYEGRGPSTAGDTKTREYLAPQNFVSLAEAGCTALVDLVLTPDDRLNQVAARGGAFGISVT